MPFGILKLTPGVDVIETPTLNGAQLTASMLIRFYKGLPQKRGGWVRRTLAPLLGNVNALHGWTDLSLRTWLGIGTDHVSGSSLEVMSSVGALTDITPSPAPAFPGVWSLDNFGQILLAAFLRGPLYSWTPGDPAALAVGGSSPTDNQSILVMPQVQILLSLGSETGSVFNALLVRWSDAGDYTSWTPTATNQAGSYVIPQGSYIVGGVASGLNVLIWTDVGVTGMTYQGLPFVFGFQPIATGCGLFGRRSVGMIGTWIMWLAGPSEIDPSNRGVPAGFFQMTMGASPPTPVQCDVWDIFIANGDFSDADVFFMAVTEAFTEFELFFPLSHSSPFFVANSVEWGSIKYNKIDNAWDYTISPQLQRTAWEHSSPVGPPVGADIAGFIQQHEVGHDAGSSPMVWSWQTGDFDLGQGEEMVLVDWLIPDFATNGTSPTITLTVGARPAPNAPAITESMTVTPSTYWTPNFALRGRQFYLAASGSDAGTFNRLGAIRYRAAPDGRGP